MLITVEVLTEVDETVYSQQLSLFSLVQIIPNMQLVSKEVHLKSDFNSISCKIQKVI